MDRTTLAKWTWRGGIAGLIALLLADSAVWFAWHRELVPTNIHRDLIGIGLLLIFVGGMVDQRVEMRRLRADSIAPVREAFMHGIQFEREQAAVRAMTGDGAQVLTLPMSRAYSREVAATGPRHRAVAGRRPAPRPR